MIDSPYKNKTWEFFVTPLVFATALLIKLLVLTAPVGYEIVFTIRALSNDELMEIEDNWDDY